jgi:hypothetical protein
MVSPADSEQSEDQKSNVILSQIQKFQQSDYSGLEVDVPIQEYIMRHRYIEELHKFLEDAQYQ